MKISQRYRERSGKWLTLTLTKTLTLTLTKRLIVRYLVFACLCGSGAIIEPTTPVMAAQAEAGQSNRAKATREIVSLPLAQEPPTTPESRSTFLSSRTSYRIRVIEETKLRDESRNKELQIRITYPEHDGPFPLIIWSHGMYGAKDNYQPLVKPWAQAGYVVIQPTHSDSLSLMPTREALRTLAQRRLDNTQDWPSRPLDIKFIIESIDQIVEFQPRLRGKIDKQMIGVGGHSFGAVTTQLIGGTKPRQAGEAQGKTFSDERAVALVAISPNGAGPFFGSNGFADLSRPILFISGSNDSGRQGENPEWRREAFEGAKPGDKYLGWIDGAYHNFGGISGAGGRARQLIDRAGEPSSRHIEIVSRTTLVFWDAYLKENGEAKQLLQHEELIFPRSELKWERK